MLIRLTEQEHAAINVVGKLPNQRCDVDIMKVAECVHSFFARDAWIFATALNLMKRAEPLNALVVWRIAIARECHQKDRESGCPLQFKLILVSFFSFYFPLPCCRLCLHRAGLARFVPNSINSGLGLHLCDAEGNKMFKSVRHYIEAKVGRAIKIGPGGIPGVGRIVGKSSTIQGKDADSQVDVQTTKKRRASTEKGKKVTKRARKAKETSVSQEKKGKHKKGGPRHSTSHLSNTEDEEDSIGESSGGGSRPNSNQPTVSSTGRKIKLTFKARNSMEEYTVMKEGSSGTRIRAIKPVGQVLESVAKATARATKASTLGRTRGRRPKSITTTPLQVIDSGNIWVKSKADEAAPSSSDDEMMEDMDPYEASSTESDDGAGQDDMEERESEAESVTPSNRNSPEAGQIEFSYPHTSQAPQAAPQLTMTGCSVASNPSPFQSGEVFLQEMEEDAFPFHSAPDLALIMNQLRSAGYV